MKEFQGVRESLVLDPGEDNNRNSEGDIIQLNDDRLVFAYSRFSSFNEWGHGDFGHADIMMRISEDFGKTWSQDKMLVENEGKVNVMSVSLLRLQNGDILLFYLRKDGWDECKLYVRRSTDEMQSFSDPVCATPEANPQYKAKVVNNDRVIQLSSGRILAPVACHPCTDGNSEAFDRRGIASCYISDDNGITWRQGSSQIKRNDETSHGLQEPGIIELSDGTIWMFIRTDGGYQYQSFSKDAGETWSEPVPTNIASPTSPASIKRIPWNGDLVLVWNDHSGAHPFNKKVRSPLCIAISDDEGKTWSKSKVLEDNPTGRYCYTSITPIETREGMGIFLSYCAGDESTRQYGKLTRLKITYVSNDWLYK